MTASRARTLFGDLPGRTRWVMIAMLWATVAFAIVATHRAFSREFYRVERARLETIALAAACSGARLLPRNPGEARRTAHGYAERSGIPVEDIVLIFVAENRRSLTVKLACKVPLPFGLFDWGASQVLTVNARADLQPTLLPELDSL